jgi:hypothetical protein
MAGMSPDPSTFCREVEAYLCRKNDGHLIRIVGPAFEQVRGWAERGIPLTVAYRGIDRSFERYYAKGPRRRPVRVEFCEADVLDVFDEWRRAVGLVGTVVIPGGAGASTGSATDDQGAPAEAGSRRGSLPAHLDRAQARLDGAPVTTRDLMGDVLDEVRHTIDTLRASARGLRGDARQPLIARLEGLDRLLLEAARARVSPASRAALEEEAAAELAPFRSRLSAEAYDRSRGAAFDRLLREQLRLPILAYDP